MKKALHDFVEFIRERGVVGLAIGFMLGASVNELVASLVEDIIQPIVGIIFGSPEGLAELAVGPVRYGEFLVVLIDFTIIAAVIFFGFKMLKLEKLDKKKE